MNTWSDWTRVLAPSWDLGQEETMGELTKLLDAPRLCTAGAAKTA